MEIREALMKQAPSLALQRAAADEIAKLDKQVWLLGSYLTVAYQEKDRLNARIRELMDQLIKETS